MDRRKLKYLRTVVLGGHLFNPPWQDRLERRRRRGRAIREAAAAYLAPYAHAACDLPEEPCLKDEPRRIFTLWMQGEDKAPALVKACLGSIRSHAGCEVVVLDGRSLSDWITLPPYILELWKSGRMKAAHFADICRIELLYRYGGVWMDATDYLPAALPEWLWEEDFFVYRGGDTLRGSYAFIQNCFIRGAKGAYILKVWREAVFAYWAHEDKAVDYFVHQLLFGFAVSGNPRAAALFSAMPQYPQEPTHRLWHGSADLPYDAQLFDEICRGALFQKTDYKSPSARSPRPGSMADHLLRPSLRRLFLFAAYDPKGAVSETDLYYLKALKPYGDIRFVADQTLSGAQQAKLEGLVSSIRAERHGEYDFGSYKRALEGVDLAEYDVVYLLNDSVIGPLTDLGYELGRLERSGASAFGLGWHPSRQHPHLQSWFIGLTPEVFLSDWFSHFMYSIRPVPDKQAVCELYEIGLYRQLVQHGATVYAPWSLKGKSIYDEPLRLFRQGFPFIKKASFTRHGGNMGARLSRVMDGMDPQLREAVVSDFDRLHGTGATERLLSRNPLRMLWRYLRYVKKKILGKR